MLLALQAEMIVLQWARELWPSSSEDEFSTLTYDLHKIFVFTRHILRTSSHFTFIYLIVQMTRHSDGLFFFTIWPPRLRLMSKIIIITKNTLEKSYQSWNKCSNDLLKTCKINVKTPTKSSVAYWDINDVLSMSGKWRYLFFKYFVFVIRKENSLIHSELVYLKLFF